MRKLSALILLLLLAIALPAQVKLGGTAKVGGTTVVRTPPVGGFPNAAVVDDFNRPDESPMTGWTDAWQSGSSGFAVVSNDARPSSPGNSTVYRSTTDYGPQVDVAAILAAIDSYQQIGFLLVSEGTSGLDGYLLSYSGTSLEMYRIDDGSFNLIAACSVTVSLSSGDSIGARRITGGTLTTYTCASGAGCGQSGAGWTQRGTCTDNTYTAAGKAGFRAGGNSSHFDDFRIATQ